MTQDVKMKELMSMVTLDPQWLSVTLEEYKSLRAESLTAMANQQAVLRLGIAVIGFAITLSVGVDDGRVRYYLFAILIPIFCLFFFTLYAIEFARMVRVGRYIENVEAKMNMLFSSQLPPLGWETWLNKGVGREEKKKPRLPYYAVVPATFLLTTAFSAVIAFPFHAEGPFSPSSNLLMLSAIGLIAVALICAISLRLVDLRKEYDKYFSP